MEKTIFLSDVLKEMKKLDSAKQPIPFSISGRTFSANNQTGGKTYFYRDAELMQAPKKKGAARLADSATFRNPNHFTNRTRNLKTEHGERKINILFIENFNGYRVIF